MRPELIHPMLVHFPIALLFTGVLIRLAAIFTKKKTACSFLLPASWLILLLGIIAAWIAVIAGEIAREIVSPTLENMHYLNEHSEHAYLTAWSFTLALFIDGFRAFLISKKPKLGVRFKKGLAIAMWLFYLFGLGNLIATGIYGAALVYEQGAAVK